MRRIILRSLVWGGGILLLGILAVAAFLFVGEAEPAEDITWGATFGHSQAESLGLDWQETYLALLDDVQVRRFRIPVYWDELEREHGQFDFSPWDWQLAELDKRGGKASLAIGFKLPRWPECRMPSWAQELTREERNEEILEMMEVVVKRYREHPAVWGWQVENEPFLTFGECPEDEISAEQLDREIQLVRELDPGRPVILTDTGENSSWLQMGKRADVFSSTLFRIIHDPRIGFVHYPYPPVMYHRKAVWLHWWYPDVRVIVGELQAEPWVTSLPIPRHSLEEQYKTMSPQQFRDVISYAKRTGLDEFYFWGAEWWYWVKKEKGDERVWDIAKETFQTP